MKAMKRWIVPMAAVAPMIAVAFATMALAWWANDTVTTATATVFDSVTHEARAVQPKPAQGCNAEPRAEEGRS